MPPIDDDASLSELFMNLQSRVKLLESRNLKLEFLVGEGLRNAYRDGRQFDPMQTINEKLDDLEERVDSALDLYEEQGKKETAKACRVWQRPLSLTCWTSRWRRRSSWRAGAGRMHGSGCTTWRLWTVA